MIKIDAAAKMVYLVKERTMTKKFEELESKMSEAARARVAKRVEETLKEIEKTERAETAAPCAVFSGEAAASEQLLTAPSVP
jgi:hypothetical protein